MGVESVNVSVLDIAKCRILKHYLTVIPNISVASIAQDECFGMFTWLVSCFATIIGAYAQSHNSIWSVNNWFVCSMQCCHLLLLTCRCLRCETIKLYKLHVTIQPLILCTTMIEITAKLLRGPVYFSGEAIECLVTFSNPPNPIHQTSQSHSDLFECLAWASAQVHCQCSTNGKVVLSDKLNTTARLAAINADTTFAPWQQDSGHAVMNTKPKILFCDLRLSAGESKTLFDSRYLSRDYTKRCSTFL